MQLILNEITVSRNHCRLFLLNNGEIELEDQGSKFGTLVLVQAKKMEILNGLELDLQYSNNFFQIALKKEFSFSCCGIDVVDKGRSYEKINYNAVHIKNDENVMVESDSEGGGDNENEEDKNKNENENTKVSKNNNVVNPDKVIEIKKNDASKDGSRNKVVEKDEKEEINKDKTIGVYSTIDHDLVGKKGGTNNNNINEEDKENLVDKDGKEIMLVKGEQIVEEDEGKKDIIDSEKAYDGNSENGEEEGE